MACRVFSLNEKLQLSATQSYGHRSSALRTYQICLGRRWLLGVKTADRHILLLIRHCNEIRDTLDFSQRSAAQSANEADEPFSVQIPTLLL